MPARVDLFREALTAWKTSIHAFSIFRTTRERRRARARARCGAKSVIGRPESW